MINKLFLLRSVSNFSACSLPEAARKGKRDRGTGVPANPSRETLAPHTSSPSPSKMERGPGGEARRALLHLPFSMRPHLKLLDRKSTRLNSSHGSISYAVFCL